MAFAIPRFNAQPGQAVPLAPRMDPGEAAAGGLMLARAGQRAMDTSVEIQRQAQGMRRMEALAGASQEMADLAGEVDKATDPDAIRPMIQQRAQAIREKWLGGLSGDAEGIASVGLRLTESTSGLTRAGDRRALALRTDAFNARVLDAQRELTTRAANGDAEAVRTFGALLEEGVRSGFYGPTDAAKQQQAFQAEVQGAQVLRMVRDNPGAVAGVLADPSRFTALRADQRERFVTAAASRQQALAAQSIAADNRAETARRRQAEAAAAAAEKDIIDYTRQGNVPAAQAALQRLRANGTGDSYRTYEGIVNGTVQDIPTTPNMRAMVADRLADPANPLTRDEMNGWLAEGKISQGLVAETLPRIRERENADFREAEAFVGRALNVPSGTIADRDLQPWQRQARLQAPQVPPAHPAVACAARAARGSSSAAACRACLRRPQVRSLPRPAPRSAPSTRRGSRARSCRSARPGPCAAASPRPARPRIPPTPGRDRHPGRTPSARSAAAASGCSTGA